jgi:hypothetical protein
MRPVNDEQIRIQKEADVNIHERALVPAFKWRDTEGTKPSSYSLLDFLTALSVAYLK